MPTIAETWDAIETWFQTNLPEVLADLNPPANETTIRDVETTIGQALPDDFKALYRLHNGQRFNNVSGLFFHQIFIPLETVLERWTEWRNMLRDDPDLNTGGGYTSNPANAISTTYMNNGWIPFTYDQAGNHLGVDLAPGAAGQRGQVINFGRDEYGKFVLADSLDKFLVWTLEQLRTNTTLSTEDEVRQYGYKQVFLKTPENRNLFEAIKTIFKQ